MFTVRERALEDLACVELRVGTGSASLCLRFRKHDAIHIDHATAIEHLEMLGARLAAVAGVELQER